MDFGDEITRGAQLFESGKLAEAAELFKRLAEKEDLGRAGRAIASVNLAVTYDRMGHPDHAVAAYEYGVGVVVTDYVFAQEHRAAYLFNIGRIDDAIGVWEHLLDLDFLPQQRADAFRQSLDAAIAKRRQG
jgi:tetratricopeptide (TPR) repeat protein